MTLEGPYPEWQTPAITGFAASGAFVVGDTLSTTNGTWANNPTSYNYQWQSVRGGVPTNVGSNQNTYVTQPSDVGNTIQVVVTAANRYGSSAPAVSASIGPIASGMAFPAAASGNRRYLLDQNSQPFLLLSDQLMPSLNKATISDYTTIFADRQSRGFNGVWLTLTPDSNVGGSSDSIVDVSGNAPWPGSGPAYTAPTTGGANALSAFWNNVDTVVSLAASYGITLLLCTIETNGAAVSMANSFGTTGCYNYGVFLGNRYKNSPNIIWYHTNDFGASNGWLSGPPSYNPYGGVTVTALDGYMGQIVAGIRSTGDTHLHAAELNYNLSMSSDDSSTTGISSGGWRSVQDLNQMYTYYQTYDAAYMGYFGCNSNDSPGQAQRYAPKPTFLGEANYELANNAGGGRAGTYTLRLQSYWTVLAGGLVGQVWGNKALHHLNSGWQSNLATQGAKEAGYWASFFRSIAYQNLIPEFNFNTNTHALVTAGAQTYAGGAGTLICTNTGEGVTSAPTSLWVTGAYTPDGSLAVVYAPAGQAFTLDMTRMRGTTTQQWYDPTTGTYSSAGSNLPNTGTHTFQNSANHAPDPVLSPTQTVNDWVLLLTA